MAQIVYILCALTSLACAIMLFRGYLGNRTPFLLWSSLSFIGLTLNNMVLFIDAVVLPLTNLESYRVIGLAAALVGLMLLIYGLVSDAV